MLSGNDTQLRSFSVTDRLKGVCFSPLLDMVFFARMSPTMRQTETLHIDCIYVPLLDLDCSLE